MGQKDVATLVEITAGRLSFIKSWELTITDSGTDENANIGFTALTFEGGGRKKVNHLSIFNDGGANDVFVVYDALASTINS